MTDRRLYLIRHARPDYDSTDHADTPLGRHYDPPLGEVGLEQAQRLADRLALLPRPSAIYASTLQRAVQTARVFADLVDMPVIERDDLCEWFAGEWEAKDFEQIFEEHPEAIDLFRNQEPAWHLAPGSERSDDFQQRCVDAVESIVADHPEGDVVVVAHGGVINAYFSHILGIRDQDMFFLPENTSLNTVMIRGDDRLAWFLSDASHLTDPGGSSREKLAAISPARPDAVRSYTRPRRSGRIHRAAPSDRAPPSARGAAVAVKFLSPEWADAVKAQLNANEAFRQAASNQHATIQQVITADEGATHYWIVIADGAIEMGVGDADGPDATITQSYDTAVKLAKSELNVVTAFMTGKVKVAGNMGMLMALQGALAQLPEAMQAVDTDY